AQRMRGGSDASNNGSIHTFPVNHSAGPSCPAGLSRDSAAMAEAVAEEAADACVSTRFVSTFPYRLRKAAWQRRSFNSKTLFSGVSTGDLTFDAVRIGKIYTPAFASRREAGDFKSRDRIGGIVIRDAVAVVMQAGLLALEERQPAFARGKEAFFSPRFQAKVFLIPFLRTLHVAHT